MELEEELSARITDALTMFQSNLRGRRKITVKSMSESRRTFDTCCILPTAYWQSRSQGLSTKT